MNDAHSRTPQPGDAVHFALDDGMTIPATVVRWRHEICVIRIAAHRLRIAAPVITTVPPDRLIAE